MELPCVHVYRGDASVSSRIQMQLNWREGTILDCKTPFLSIKLLSHFFRKRSVFVFHGQSTLPYLVLVIILRVIFRSGAKFIYDMHDLNERPRSFGVKAYLRYSVFYLIEHLISMSNVQVITVSKGLSRIFYKRFKKTASVVYNVAFEIDGCAGIWGSCSDGSAGAGIVYFGLIKPDRLPFDMVEDVLGRNPSGVFDVFGRSPSGVGSAYEARLGKLSTTTTLRLCGAYNPKEMGFLSAYRYSWLCFESDRLNIRYCMPNKLFQSLSAGLCCVISDRLVEARVLFGGGCIGYREFIAGGAGCSALEDKSIDWAEIEGRMRRVAERSRDVFLSVCSM